MVNFLKTISQYVQFLFKKTFAILWGNKSKFYLFTKKIKMNRICEDQNRI
jgi:hypothetical protein